MKQVEKGIPYHRVVAAEACVLTDAVRLTTTLDLMRRYKGVKEDAESFEVTEEEDKEIDRLVAKLAKSLEDRERLMEMWRKHPLT